MIVQWKEIYQIGHEDIDQQHKKLFEIMNNLHDVQQNGTGQIVLESIFKQLTDYMAFHFSTEETLMTEVNYPNIEQHINAHEDFISRIYHCENKSKLGNLIISIKVLNYLKEWVIDHILGTDKELGEYLKQKNESEYIFNNIYIK